jgi:hypothetical protein
MTANLKEVAILGVGFFLCFGSAEGQQRLYHLRGEPDLDGFGNRVAGIGDVNDDGVPDFAVGAIGVGLSRPVSAMDKVVVFSGRDGTELYQIEIPVRKFSWPHYYRDIIGLGDIDGDGAGDMAIGVPGTEEDEERGMVMIVSGRNGSLIRTDTSESTPNRFGEHLAVFQDMDADEIMDYAVTDAGGASPVQLISGRTGDVLLVVGGGELLALGRFASVPDMNGDGVEDLLLEVTRSVRDPATGLSEFAERDIAVISGAARGEHRITETNPDGELVLEKIPLESINVGYLSCAGDVNADGTPDVVVSSFSQDHWATVFSGRDGRILRAWPSVESPVQGASSRGVGDIDGDGHDDVAIGLRARGNSGLMQANITIHSGRTWRPIMVIGPSQFVLNRFPSVFEVAEDMNNDGYPELLIGVGSTGGSANVLAPGFKGYVDVVSLRPPTGTVPSIHTIRSMNSQSPFLQRREVHWFSRPGSSYRVDVSEDLDTWIPSGLEETVTTIGTSGHISIDTPALWQKGYFRVVEVE